MKNSHNSDHDSRAPAQAIINRTMPDGCLAKGKKGIKNLCPLRKGSLGVCAKCATAKREQAKRLYDLRCIKSPQLRRRNPEVRLFTKSEFSLFLSLRKRKFSFAESIDIVKKQREHDELKRKKKNEKARDKRHPSQGDTPVVG